MENLRKQRAALDKYHKQRRAKEEKRYGGLPDRVAMESTFEEKPFGYAVETSAIDTNDFQALSRIVVSLALLDGDKMLFACSDIPLPDTTPTKLHQTRFVEVRLPHNETVAGFLGLYDEDIAIVTSLCLLDLHPVDLDHPVALPLQEKQVSDDDHVLAIGCLFKSGTLRATGGSLHREQPDTWVPDAKYLSEAVLGGPLIGNGARFLGMNHKHHGDANVTFLSQKFLHERLEHFQILNSKELHFRGYSLPKDVSRIVPSGFFNTINRIKSYGYPIPPPLVLELNGQLLNRFEDFFGDIIAWKGYSFGSPPRGSEYGVWKRLPKKVLTDVSHRVVSIASYNGDRRFFVCTGLLIKWHGKRTVVLTSASLVRSPCNEDNIDTNLTIKVFVPPNHFSGTLECAEHKDVKLDCKDLQLSTCKINKAGIGGPLISLDGSFIGMNFYDRRKVTPFLPQSKILDVLCTANSMRLPSERGESPFEDFGGKAEEKKNKWPVPEPYWYHGLLNVDRYDVPELPGRHLD
ncbi:hypothetical protein QOZ80_2BG0200000 [Eleusine coracana subsp. coracana]|nr:hypothetical protein QOZ80_2BG0200000 [Eleusine coracana subsp. coracana]